LLANIALHGMEETIGVEYEQYKKSSKNSKWEKEATVIRYKVKQGSATVVRYADDFVILCYSKEEAEKMYDKLSPYLEKRGLTLATDKTKISSIHEGFDFLSYSFKRFEHGNYKGSHRKTPPPPLVVKPSIKSIKKARRKIAEIFKKFNSPT
jgi:RNA-directed DNA polymerase